MSQQSIQDLVGYLDFIKVNNTPIDELLKEYEYFDLANNGEVWSNKILHKHIDPNTPITIFELGTGIGSGTVWMSENLCSHADSIIHTAGIDPKNGIDKFAQQRLEKYNNVVYYNEYGNSVIKRLKLMYDMIYIDGTHKYLSTLNDAKLSLKFLKENGIIVFDDYQIEWPGVIQAVDEFIAMYKLELERISPTQALVKRGELSNGI
jgi:predicted O-methyltransferase YrrM